MTPRKDPADYLKLGRPMEYKPEYCEQAIEYGKLGKSRTWIAGAFKTTKKTLTNWEEHFPEFLHAMDAARVQSQIWWEDAGQKGMTEQGFNAAIWSRSMSARFQEDWRENKRNEISGPDGGPIRVENDGAALAFIESKLAGLAEREGTDTPSWETDSSTT